MFAGVTVGGGAFVFWLSDGFGTAGADLPSDPLVLILAHIRSTTTINTATPSTGNNRRRLADLGDAIAGDEACVGAGKAGARVPQRSQNLSLSRRLLPQFVQFLFTIECLYC